MESARQNSMPKPARTRRRGEDAKRAILDAADALLTAGGIEEVQLKPIATAAGITHSGVLHHFGSREGLLEALFKRQSTQMRGEILGRPRAHHAGPDSRRNS